MTTIYKYNLVISYLLSNAYCRMQPNSRGGRIVKSLPNTSLQTQISNIGPLNSKLKVRPAEHFFAKRLDKKNVLVVKCDGTDQDWREL